MADIKYTKKLIVNWFTEESASIHLGQPTLKPYVDWFYDQVEQGRADASLDYNPYTITSATTGEMLVVDQEQADSHIACINQVAEQVGFPVACTVVDYTE